MAIHKLTVRNFRIHRELTLALSSGITVLTGPNGSGKTSILEAIALLASAKSFRSGANGDFIARGSDGAWAEISVSDSQVEDRITIEISEARKRSFLNKKPISRRRQISERLPYVVFSPADLRLVDGEAADRRDWLNSALCNVDFAYADLLRDYTKILTQRNRLLKDLGPECGFNVEKLGADFEVWDQKFLDLGAELVIRRLEYLSSLFPYLQARYSEIAGSEDHFAAEYLPNGWNVPESREILRQALAQQVRQSRARDLHVGSSSVGPHRDEISLTINANKAKFCGSQGEKRTSVLALRLAEVDLFRKLRGRDPVLLIDDVSSELDSKRRRALVGLLKQGGTQVLITATELPVDLLNDVQHPFDHLDLMAVGREES